MPSYRDPNALPTRQLIPHPNRLGCFLPVHRRPMRLPGVDYANSALVCFVTLRMEPGGAAPLDSRTAAACWQAFLDVRRRIAFKDHGTCLMPDHLHGLGSPTGSGESIGDIVGRFKTWSRTCVRAECRLLLSWQEGFYDHVLRASERSADEFDAIVAYIRGNPERAGLVDRWTDYPFISGRGSEA